MIDEPMYEEHDGWKYLLCPYCGERCEAEFADDRRVTPWLCLGCAWAEPDEEVDSNVLKEEEMAKPVKRDMVDDRIDWNNMIKVAAPPEGWDGARAFLLEANTWNLIAQREHREKINQAFRTYWAGPATEEDFAQVTTGLVLTPEMLYIMSGRKT